MNRDQLRMRQSENRGYGKMHFDKKPKPTMVNTRTCPKCGAKPGQMCFVLTGSTFRELKTTHTVYAVDRDLYRERKTPRPTAEELEARRRSQPILEARHAEKKRKEAESRARVNGG
jgi:hypothetical protein